MSCRPGRSMQSAQSSAPARSRLGPPPRRSRPAGDELARIEAATDRMEGFIGDHDRPGSGTWERFGTPDHRSPGIVPEQRPWRNRSVDAIAICHRGRCSPVEYERAEDQVAYRARQPRGGGAARRLGSRSRTRMTKLPTTAPAATSRTRRWRAWAAQLHADPSAVESGDDPLAVRARPPTRLVPQTGDSLPCRRRLSRRTRVTSARGSCARLPQDRIQRRLHRVGPDRVAPGGEMEEVGLDRPVDPALGVEEAVADVEEGDPGKVAQRRNEAVDLGDPGVGLLRERQPAMPRGEPRGRGRTGQRGSEGIGGGSPRRRPRSPRRSPGGSRAILLVPISRTTTSGPDPAEFAMPEAPPSRCST